MTDQRRANTYTGNYLIDEKIISYLELPMKIHKKKFEKSMNKIRIASGYYESRWDEETDSISDEYFLYHYRCVEPKNTLSLRSLHHHMTKEQWVKVKNYTWTIWIKEKKILPLLLHEIV